MKRLLHTLLFLLLVGMTLFAQTTITWNGLGDGISWSDASNWDLGVIPNNSHLAVLDNGDAVQIASAAEVHCLELSNASSLTVSGNGTLMCNADANSVITFNSTSSLTNDGQITANRIHMTSNANSTFTNNSGATLTISGLYATGSTYKFFIDAGCSFINNGIFHATNGDSVTGRTMQIRNSNAEFINNGEANFTGSGAWCLYVSFNGSLTNSGNLNFAMDSDFNSRCIYNIADFTNSAGGEIDIKGISGSFAGSGIQGLPSSDFSNHGLIKIRDQGQIPLQITSPFTNNGTLDLSKPNNPLYGEWIIWNSSGAPTTLTNNGTIKGSGAIQVEGSIQGSGTISPGFSPGKITYNLSTNFGSGSGASYAYMEIESNAGPGIGHDMLEGAKATPSQPDTDINLNDMDVDFDLINGFVPAVGDEFVVVKAEGELSGNFGIIGFPFLPNPDHFWEIEYDYVDDEVKIRVATSVVPVELVRFEATRIGDYHQLTWETANELNFSHFDIQYSLDNQVWGSIGEINSKGSRVSGDTYSFKYYPIKEQNIHYYRLNMIDYDGSHEYSHIRSLKESKDSKIKVFPNPVRGMLQIEGIRNYTLINSIGEVIASGNSTTLDVSNYPNGMYYVLDLTNSSNRQRIIISN